MSTNKVNRKLKSKKNLKKSSILVNYKDDPILSKSVIDYIKVNIFNYQP